MSDSLRDCVAQFQQNSQLGYIYSPYSANNEYPVEDRKAQLARYAHFSEVARSMHDQAIVSIALKQCTGGPMPTPRKFRTYLIECSKEDGTLTITVFLSDRLLSFIPLKTNEVAPNVSSWHEVQRVCSAHAAYYILTDFFGSKVITTDLYQNFRDNFLQQIPEQGGVITTEQINAWFTRYKSRLEA